MSRKEPNLDEANIILNFAIESKKPKRLKRLLEALRSKANDDGELVFQAGHGFAKDEFFSVSAHLIKKQKKVKGLKSQPSKTTSRSTLSVVIKSHSPHTTLARTYNAMAEILDNKKVTRSLQGTVASLAAECFTTAGLHELGSKQQLDIRDGYGSTTRIITI